MDGKEAVEIIGARVSRLVIPATDPIANDLEAWEKAGAPITIYPMGGIDDVTLWGDQGYGQLYLIRGKELVDQGRDFVSLANEKGVYVGLSEYYGEKQAGLYKR